MNFYGQHCATCDHKCTLKDKGKQSSSILYHTYITHTYISHALDKQKMYQNVLFIHKI